MVRVETLLVQRRFTVVMYFDSRDSMQYSPAYQYLVGIPGAVALHARDMIRMPNGTCVFLAFGGTDPNRFLGFVVHRLLVVGDTWPSSPVGQMLRHRLTGDVYKLVAGGEWYVRE